MRSTFLERLNQRTFPLLFHFAAGTWHSLHSSFDLNIALLQAAIAEYLRIHLDVVDVYCISHWLRYFKEARGTRHAQCTQTNS